jgi:hypothetical protein
VFFINEDISALDKAGSFAIVGTSCDVIEGAAEAGFEKKERILRGGNVPIVSR